MLGDPRLYGGYRGISGCNRLELRRGMRRNFHTFELKVEYTVGDSDVYATAYRRCHGYLIDDLRRNFDQTASYVYTDPASDS